MITLPPKLSSHSSQIYSMKYMVRKKRLKESVPCARKETFCLRRKCRVLSNDLSISLSLFLSFCLSFPLSLSLTLSLLSLSLCPSLSLSLYVCLSHLRPVCVFFSLSTLGQVDAEVEMTAETMQNPRWVPLLLTVLLFHISSSSFPLFPTSFLLFI